MPDRIRFLCDESVDRHIVVSLRECGFDVTYISEDHPGIEDTEVLEIAEQDRRILLTEDKDFGDLVFRTRQSAHGVMLIRLSDLSSRDAASLVRDVIVSHEQEFVGHFAVLNSKSLRIRELEI